MIYGESGEGGIKTIEEATGLLLPEDNLIKNCITP